MLKFLLYGTAIAALGMPAKAATIQYDFENDIQWINVTGEITAGDFESFKRQAAKANGKVTVFFNSPGGNLIEALQIGEFIRLRGWLTLAANCFSACSLSWLSGSPRMIVAGESQIGFHAASVNGQERGTGNALIGAYMNRIGLGYDAIAWATTASPTDMSILTPEKAKELGIDVTVISKNKQANSQPAAPEPISTSRDCSAISAELRDFFPTQFDDCSKPPTANSENLKTKFTTLKSWDRYVSSSGRFVTRIIQQCAPNNEPKKWRYLMCQEYRLIAKDHDANGISNGGSVCYFDKSGWSDCETNMGEHYKLGARSIKAFLNIAAGTDQ